MLNYAAPVKPQHIHHRSGQRPISLLPEVDVSSIIRKSRVEDGEVGCCNESRQASNARLIPSRLRARIVLDDASVEMIAKCGGYISIDVELVDELAKYGYLLLSSRRSGWAVACCRCKWEKQ